MFSIKHFLGEHHSLSKTIRTSLLVIFFIYLALLIYTTFFAWNYGASLGPTGPGGRNYNVFPFRSIYRIAMFSPSLSDPIKILLGNVLLFLPLGFLLPLVKRGVILLKVTLIGMLLSFFIELNQFLFTFRVADVDDLILNTVGAFLGGTLFFLCRRMKRKVVIVLPSSR